MARNAFARSSAPIALVFDTGTEASCRVRRFGPPARTRVSTGAAGLGFRAALFFRAVTTFDARVRDVAGARVLPAFLEPDFGARFAGMLDPRCVAWLDELLEEGQTIRATGTPSNVPFAALSVTRYDRYAQRRARR